LADTEKAIIEITELIRETKEKLEQNESIGLDVADVGELTIEDYTSKGYNKAAKVRNTKTVYLKNIEATAPSDLKEVVPILEEILTTLHSKQESKGKLEKFIDKLATFGTWATLVYNILHTSGHI
jgi:hypothetical protein